LVTALQCSAFNPVRSRTFRRILRPVSRRRFDGGADAFAAGPRFARSPSPGQASMAWTDARRGHRVSDPRSGAFDLLP